MAKQNVKSIDEQIAAAEERVKYLRRKKIDDERVARINELEAKVGKLEAQIEELENSHELDAHYEELEALLTWAQKRTVNNTSYTVYDLFTRELAAADEDATDASDDA